MPVYEYECSKCRKAMDIYLPLDDYDKAQFCECKNQLTKIIGVPYVSIKSYGFKHQGLGIDVKDKDSVKDYLKKRKDNGEPGLIEVGDAKPHEFTSKQPKSDYSEAEAGLKRELEKHNFKGVGVE